MMKNLIEKIKQRIQERRYGCPEPDVFLPSEEVPAKLFSKYTPGFFVHVFSTNGLEFAVKARDRSEAWSYATRLAKGSKSLLVYKGTAVIENE